jgi:hypothetical protein
VAYAGVAAFNQAWERAFVVEPDERRPIARVGGGFYELLHRNDPKDGSDDEKWLASPLRYRASILAAARWLDELYRCLVVVGQPLKNVKELKGNILGEIRSVPGANGNPGVEAEALKEAAQKLIAYLQEFLSGEGPGWGKNDPFRKREHFALNFLGYPRGELRTVF